MMLAAVPGDYAVCRLPPDAPLPDWFGNGLGAGLWSATRTPDELSLVLLQDAVPPDVVQERNFRAVRVAGTLDFALVGVLASLTNCLADAQVSVFALSTFDTDYLLVRASDWDAAVAAWEAAGHIVAISPAPSQLT